jgi:hypothetical protein
MLNPFLTNNIMAKKKENENIEVNETGKEGTEGTNTEKELPKRSKLEKKSFSLDDFKKQHKFDKQTTFKKQDYIYVDNVLGNKAFVNATGINIPLGSNIQIQGHTNSGKTTLLFEIARSCMEQNILPIFIITELKFSFAHLRLMGIPVEEEVDEETGEVTYKGNFLYIDRSKFETIEEMGEQILILLELQQKGKLATNICFLIDSLGTLESDQCKASKKSNNEWCGLAMQRTFGKSVMPRIELTKTEEYPYTATLVAINQVWVRKPDPKVYGSTAKQETRGGNAFAFNSKIRIMFGNVDQPGTSMLKIKYKGKEVCYATRSKVTVIKNHDNGISLSSRIILTPHGFLPDSEGDKIAKEYFKQHADFFMSQIGGGNPDEVEFDEELVTATDVSYSEED